MHGPVLTISGYYGFDNTGDEAVLAGILESLRTYRPDIRCIVLSGNPQHTAAEYSVEAVSRMSPLGVWGALKRSAMLISGGGSLFQDSTSPRTVPYYAAVIHMAAMAGIPAFMYAQGVGPLATGLGRAVTAGIRGRLDGVTVRDEDSAALLVELGFPPGAVAVTADPVFALSPAPKAEGSLHAKECIPREVPVVGISIRRTAHDDVYLPAVAHLARGLVAYGCRVVLVPFHYPDDLRMCDAVAEASGLNGISVLRQAYAPGQLLRIVGEMDLMVGTRLHSLIFAARMGVPFIGLSYDPKVSSFCRLMDMECHAVSGVDGGILLDSAVRALGRLTELQASLAVSGPRLRELALGTAVSALEVCSGTRGARYNKM